MLVIEKGAYHHEDAFTTNEVKSFENLYENGGFTPSIDGNINILAGSVFGGGTTVNWSASLKLQHFVREEWAKQGLSHFLSPKVRLNLFSSVVSSIKLLFFFSLLKIWIVYLNVLVQALKVSFITSPIKY